MMKQLLLSTLFVVTAGIAGDAYGACSRPITLAGTLQQLEQPQAGTTPPEESCLCSLIATLKGHDAASVVTSYAQLFPVHDTLLICAFQHPVLRKNTAVRTSLLRSWKQTHRSLNALFLAYRQSGATGRMDTLLRILDENHSLGEYQLLQWIETKEVLDDFAPMPALFYRIITGRPQLRPLALNRFEQLLAGASASLTDSLLQQFADQIAAAPHADSTGLRRWIIDQYGRRQLHDRQITAILTLEEDPALRCPLLLAAGHTCIGNRAYGAALAAGKTLLHQHCSKELAQQAAVLLSTAYRAMDKPDSAAVWLEKSGLETTIRQREAIELYLSLGNLKKASVQLSKLPPSITRDTLLIKLQLFSDSLAAARRLITDPSTRLARNQALHSLWQFRVLLFCGATDSAAALLGTIGTGIAPAERSRLQEYRYWLLRLADTPETLAKFIRIEYTLYKGDPKKAAAQFCGSVDTAAEDWRIGLRIARAFIDITEYGEAVATLRCAPATGEPEYLYFLADALVRHHAYQEARPLLERLVLDFPADQFTTRARVLLAGIPKKKTEQTSP